jgi:hypothetical protein
MSVGFRRIVKGHYYTKNVPLADVDTELNRYFAEGGAFHAFRRVDNYTFLKKNKYNKNNNIYYLYRIIRA